LSHADVAQLVERHTCNMEVPGSEPGIGPMECQSCGTATQNPKYCSLSCANSVNTKARPRKVPKLVKCLACESSTKNPKFCSRSCAARHNGRAYPKRKRGPMSRQSGYSAIPRTPCVICESPSYVGSNVCSSFCRGLKRIQEGTAGLATLKKTKLILEGRVCSICNRKTWRGQPIPLVMDHIDGRPSNNAWENLRLVCGNCDMQLPTYKSKNKNGGRPWRNKRYAEGKSY
jgi:hypothetical protein